MARFNYSGVAITGGTGRLNSSLGGSVLLSNGVVRNYVTPTNPQTAQQTLYRNLFQFMTSAWKGLTAGQKDAWESARTTDAWTVTDPFTGTTRPFSSAKALFIYVNTNLSIANSAVGSPAVSQVTPPAQAAFEAIGLTSITITAAAGTVAVIYTGTIADSFISYRMTQPVSPGNMKLTSVKSLLRSIGVNNAVTPQALGTEYVAVHGAITGTAGQKVFYVLELINGVTGQRTPLATGSTVIV